MPTKIVKIVGGQLDGKRIRRDRLPDDSVPVGKRYAIYQYIGGLPFAHAYEVTANPVAGDVRTIVLTPAQKR